MTEKEVELVKQWAAVRSSLRFSVEGSVRTSVWDSVWASVEDSVWDSVASYMSSLFPTIPKWKHLDHPEGTNPYQPCIDLWCAGFVPSFDGKVWRLHVGEKAEGVWVSDRSFGDRRKAPCQ